MGFKTELLQRAVGLQPRQRLIGLVKFYDVHFGCRLDAERDFATTVIARIIRRCATFTASPRPKTVDFHEELTRDFH
jgi:hypothetical protein